MKIHVQTRSGKLNTKNIAAVIYPDTIHWNTSDLRIRIYDGPKGAAGVTCFEIKLRNVGSLDQTCAIVPGRAIDLHILQSASEEPIVKGTCIEQESSSTISITDPQIITVYGSEDVNIVALGEKVWNSKRGVRVESRNMGQKDESCTIILGNYMLHWVEQEIRQHMDLGDLKKFALALSSEELGNEEEKKLEMSLADDADGWAW